MYQSIIDHSHWSLYSPTNCDFAITGPPLWPSQNPMVSISISTGARAHAMDVANGIHLTPRNATQSMDHMGTMMDYAL